MNAGVFYYLQTSSVGGRRLTYKRQKKADAVDTIESDCEEEEEEGEDLESLENDDEISDMFGETDQSKIDDYQSVEENCRNIDFLCRDM